MWATLGDVGSCMTEKSIEALSFGLGGFRVLGLGPCVFSLSDSGAEDKRIITIESILVVDKTNG